MKVAVCIMCKNENEYITENVKYHLALGFDHIIVYDNMSTIPLQKTLADIQNVTVIRWSSNDLGSQCKAYDNCLKTHGSKFNWIAFIDTDEFIVLKKTTNIKDFLNAYSSYAAVGIQWKCFGSSGHKKKKKSVINSYLNATDIGLSHNKHIKSIVQPKWTKRSSGDPHHFKFKGDKICVNEHGIKIPGPFNVPPTYDTIQLNHYVTRSREDFDDKKKRGGGNVRNSDKLTEAFWQSCQGGKREDDIIKLYEKIKR
jgi:hypothetical protein